MTDHEERSEDQHAVGDIPKMQKKEKEITYNFLLVYLLAFSVFFFNKQKVYNGPLYVCTTVK